MIIGFGYLVSPFDLFNTTRHISTSYLDNNKMYIYNNYCNIDRSCNEVFEIDLTEDTQESKKYYNLDKLDTTTVKDVIRNDFPDINISKFM